MNGILAIDKPAGMTSARAVDAVKRLLPRGTKVGHAGTLDPFATGVLLVLVGAATKRCEQLMSEPKSYRATVMLGATTETDDPESPEQPSGAKPVDLAALQAAVLRFHGTVTQRPPAFSALKLGGRRAYDLARSGKPVPLKPRPVTIHRIDIVRYEWPLLELDIECGRGTYVRAIARDLGEALGVGGYLSSLRRTRVGRYGIESAVSLDALRRDGLPPLIIG